MKNLKKNTKLMSKKKAQVTKGGNEFPKDIVIYNSPTTAPVAATPVLDPRKSKYE